MRNAVVVALSALALACSSTRSAPDVSDPDLRDPKAEFEMLRSLAGEWTVVGVGDTKTDPFDMRILMLDGGATVEAVMLGRGSEAAVLTYRLDGDRITMIQRPSDGDALSMPGEPSYVPVRVKTRVSSRVGQLEPSSGMLPSVSVDRFSAHEISREPDPSIHVLWFKPAESTHVEWPVQGRLVGAGLSFVPELGINLSWDFATSEGGREIVQYRSTRKVPGGVVRTADPSDDAKVEARPRTTWQDKKAYFDLRSEP